MIQGTKFDVIDQSDIASINIDTADNSPIFLAAFASDKGTEDLYLADASKIERQFGKVSFAKYGQAQLQTYLMTSKGARVLVKRMVADDAKLANVIICSNIKKVSVQKKNDAGQLLYKTAGGAEVTESEGNTPIMIDTATVKYTAQTATAATTIGDVTTAALALLKETADGDGFKVYPLFTIMDNGRGVSSKKFRLSPDYDGSKKLDFLKYNVFVMDNTELMNTVECSMNYNMVYDSANFSLETTVNKYSDQVKANVFEATFEKYFTELKTITGLTDAFINEDIVFGKSKAGISNPLITIDPASVNLSTPNGISLASGSNGSFGSYPVSEDTDYATKLEKFFNGTLDVGIYDLDKYKIVGSVDANYPATVKRANESLAEFRGDMVFFEDLGFVSTQAGIAALASAAQANRTTYLNHLSYDVIDPYSKKQITVTAGYSLAKILPGHIMNGLNRPLAGTLHDAIIEDAIEGTVNYLPVVTPSVNQKDQLTDIRVNYASYNGSQLVLETQYTNQAKHTQLSYLNNVLAMQNIVRTVRAACPKSRYSWLDGEDLDKYKKDVQAVLDTVKSDFKTLEFEYIKDPAYVQNKIFRAAIKVRFRDYIEAEYFTIYALN